MSRKRPKPSDAASRFEDLYKEVDAELKEQAAISLETINVRSNAQVHEEPKIEDEKDSVEHQLKVAQAKITELEQDKANLEKKIDSLKDSKKIATTKVEFSEAEMRQFSKLIRRPARFSSKTSHSVSIMAEDVRIGIDHLFHTHGISPLDAQHLWNIGMIMLYVGLERASKNDEYMERLREHRDQGDLLAEIYSVLLDVAGMDNPLDLESLSNKI
ncbi:MAG: hypothetical protein GX979_08530 [Firmicutes bacterium]|nr:hypothetical protein [Bacillota bacterium]